MATPVYTSNIDGRGSNVRNGNVGIYPGGAPTGYVPPPPVALGASTTAGAGGTGEPAFDPTPYDQQIGNLQSAITRLGAQQNSGNAGIENSYQTALQQLLLSKNQAQQGYDTTKHQSAVDYVGAKNKIGSQAGSSLNGLLRLLGSRGAGGGSAYNIGAPQAVARGATLQRSDVSGAFGSNNQALDTNWNNYLTGYSNQVTGAEGQRNELKRGLNDSITQNNATLLQQMAALRSERDQANGGNGVAASQPYLDQANTLLNQLANSAPAQINYQTAAYQAPSLSSYTVNPNAAPTYQGQGASNDYFSPYLQALLGKKQPAPA